MTCRTCSYYLGFSIFLPCTYLFSSVIVKIIMVVIFLCVISSKTKPRRIIFQLKPQNFTVDLSNLENYFVHLVFKNWVNFWEIFFVVFIYTYLIKTPKAEHAAEYYEKCHLIYKNHLYFLIIDVEDIYITKAAIENINICAATEIRPPPLSKIKNKTLKIRDIFLQLFQINSKFQN